MSDPKTITPTSIPVPGTPAYWTAQREAFALIRSYSLYEDDPLVELDTLPRIAPHGFAARVMAAHGRPIADWIKSLERITARPAGWSHDEDKDRDLDCHAQPRTAETPDTLNGSAPATCRCSTAGGEH